MAHVASVFGLVRESRLSEQIHLGVKVELELQFLLLLSDPCFILDDGFFLLQPFYILVELHLLKLVIATKRLV